MRAFTYDETDAELSPEYRASIEAHNEALTAYRTAAAVFRLGGNSEVFAKAITARAIADTAFDAAYEKEQKMSDWRPESMRALDEASERLLKLLAPLLHTVPSELWPLSEALDDFVRAHMQRRDDERREIEYAAYLDGYRPRDWPQQRS